MSALSVHVGAAYYPHPGWQVIVLNIFRHARGWSVLVWHRFSDSKMERSAFIGYRDFCRLVGVEP